MSKHVKLWAGYRIYMEQRKILTYDLKYKIILKAFKIKFELVIKQI